MTDTEPNLHDGCACRVCEPVDLTNRRALGKELHELARGVENDVFLTVDDLDAMRRWLDLGKHLWGDKAHPF